MSFVPHTDDDRRAMLSALGVERTQDLFEAVPEAHRYPTLDLPAAISELELEREMEALQASSAELARQPSFLGAGSYRHWIPATVDAVLRRGELYSAYTPYQPEISQGMLQAMFEYQSMVCALTGMAVSTASHYDGATALAEAVLMALAAGRGKRPQIVVRRTLNPRYRSVLETYLQGTDAELVEASELAPSAREIAELVGSETAACVVQSPNFLGQVEPIEEIAAAAHAAGALLIVVPDPLALGLLRSPGEQGADLIAADGQPLGIPQSFGGPSLGILAASEKHMRRVPGRLVGQTVDADGERGYVLTLGTREQHIRRQKAVSNICTNAALMALAASVYLATLGKHGLRRVAELCVHKSHYAASRLAQLPGCCINPQAPDAPFVKELVLQLPSAVAPITERLLTEHGIVGGYDLALWDPELEGQMLVAITETSSRADIDRFTEALGAILASHPGAAEEAAR